jgi:hypothetical protein
MLSEFVGQCQACYKPLLSTHAGKCCNCKPPKRVGLHDECGEFWADQERRTVQVRCGVCGATVPYEYTGWFAGESVIYAKARDIVAGLRYIAGRTLLVVLIGMAIVYGVKIFAGMKFYFFGGGGGGDDAVTSLEDAFARQILKSHHYTGWNPVAMWPVITAVGLLVPVAVWLFYAVTWFSTFFARKLAGLFRRIAPKKSSVKVCVPGAAVVASAKRK